MARKTAIKITPFRWEASDALAMEHKLAREFLAEIRESDWPNSGEIDLFNLERSGNKLLILNDAEVASMILALTHRAKHLDNLGKQIRASIEDENEQDDALDKVWPERQAVAQVIRQFMRRKLAFGSEHFIAFAEWFLIADELSENSHPIKPYVKAVEQFLKEVPPTPSLRSSLQAVIDAFNRSESRETPPLAQRLTEALAQWSPAAAEPPRKQSRAQRSDPTVPAPVGDPTVLAGLKQLLKIFPPESTPPPVTVMGTDQFPLRADSTLRVEHELISKALAEADGPMRFGDRIPRSGAGAALFVGDEAARARICVALVERVANDLFQDERSNWPLQSALGDAFRQLVSRGFSREHLFDLLLALSAVHGNLSLAEPRLIQLLLPELNFATDSLTPGERHVLHRVRARLIRTPPLGRSVTDVVRINALLEEELPLTLVPGEAWSDVVNGALSKSSESEKWFTLFRQASGATGARPSPKWLKSAQDMIKAIGAKEFEASLLLWFPLVDSPRTVSMLGGGLYSRAAWDRMIDDGNATCLRGLLWMAPEVASAEIIRAVGALTNSCYKKIPGVGPRAVKVANAGVYALSQMNDPLAVAQLALLKLKIKFGMAQKEIEKAFNLAAERSGISKEELEEMSAPSYGLTEVGMGEETVGEFTARLSVAGTTSTEIVWIKADGKTQTTVPSAAKGSAEWKVLQARVKDIEKMLPAQRDRIDGLFLQQRSWPFETWRERYLDHPLIGTLARRILWEITEDSQTTTAMWFDGRLVDLDLRMVSPKSGATVRLWHPIGREIEEVTAWRNWLETQQIQQPFKQAHREIYIVTEAELRTNTYSNRFAAHILKQHQFNALCALRGWKNQLRLMVDSDYPAASLALPQWDLRAEFWVEGAGDNHRTDINESGVYLRLKTDQVRFYPIDASQRWAHAYGGGYRQAGRDVGEPLPVAEIPPLVFSEVMRDVDLFVGVTSIGNDPTWADGGEGVRVYWQDYSFGELGATAKTRKEVLQRLVPKLKIANVCRFEDKFLVVKGNLRAYKIHLGSGNILMEPNDQYLCIVTKQSDTPNSSVLLPFEGDRTLSIIISKALLLAADDKITDRSILQQINSKQRG